MHTDDLCRFALAQALMFDQSQGAATVFLLGRAADAAKVLPFHADGIAEIATDVRYIYRILVVSPVKGIVSEVG
jgi:hypothetical protein